jgi:4-amino-4-deoxy-L-arabinose transferase-like glycosyltransferase
MDGTVVTERAVTGRMVGAVLLLALLLRLGAAGVIQSRIDAQPGRFDLIEGDASGYWELARRIVRGEPYELYSPPRRVLRMPGFPLIIATGIAGFGERPGLVRGLLAVLGTLGCGLVYGLTKALAGPRIALVATIAAAISPTFVVFSVMFLSETAFAVALLASLWSLVTLFRRLRVETDPWPAGNNHRVSSHWSIMAIAIGAGLLAGVATHMRPTWIIAAPLAAGFAIVVARGRVAGWSAAVGLILGLALLILPWGLRNQRVTGHFVPTTLWFGASLYDGLRPGATGGSEMSFIETDGVYNRLSEYDADRYYRDQAFAFARAHPDEVVALALNKLGRYFSLLPNADQFANWPARLATGGWSVAVLGLAVVGLVVVGPGTAQGRTELLVVALLPLLFFAAVHAVFVGSLRYRLPAEYPLLALSATGAVAVWDWFCPVWCSRITRPPC